MKNEQINCKKLDITLTTELVFEQFAHLPHSILLDSSNAEHENSRFDIISFAPKHVIEASQSQVFLDGQLQNESCFNLMQTLLTDLCDAQVCEDLPFTGGWLGYFSYDLGRYVETIPNQAQADINIPDMSAGLYVDALIFDNKQNSWFYVSQPHSDRLGIYLEKINKATARVKPFKLSSEWQTNLNQDQYEKQFNKIQAYLESGDCYQINLAQRFSATFTGDPWSAYKTLRTHNQAPFAAFINHPKGTILSVSPERFISVENNVVESKPIKGTLPRGRDLAEDKIQAETLKYSSKDRAENVMIVDLLRNDLGKVAKAGSVIVPKLFEIESFPAVHHLVSTVQSELAEGKSPLDQLEAAFPGGSITGAPKIRAMEIIEELEPHRRSVYCGSIGYISACGKMDTSITIRTLVCSQAKIHCWAGGGIVADSVCNLEYQETLDKVNKILPILSNQ